MTLFPEAGLANSPSTDSLKSAASEATYGAFKWYYGNETGQIPGAFPDKWWEGSALFAAALNYWHLTGDTTYNDEVSVGLQWQGGDKGDYMPSNYSSYLVRITTRRNELLALTM